MAQDVHQHDVVVVGARSAGAATARLLAARGYDVALVDRAAMPSDTLSTHGLVRGGVVQLQRWGLLDRLVAGGAPPVRAVSFTTSEGTVRRPLKASAGVDFLLAPRRDRIDALMVEEARRSGAEVLLGTTASGPVRDDHGGVIGLDVETRRGAGRRLLARHVVGADGLRSTMAGAFEARTLSSSRSSATLFFAYVDEVPWDGYEFHVSEGAFAGVFPTNDGQGCVWLSRPKSLYGSVLGAGSQRTKAWLDMLRTVAPDLGRRIRNGRIVSSVRGIVAPPNYVREAWGEGWSLVGDAGYHRDPITGHGMTDAFRDAELLADAVDATLSGAVPARAALAAYQSARDQALAETYRLTLALARFPRPDRFVQLQIELSEALDREATQLASRPAPAGTLATAVA